MWKLYPPRTSFESMFSEIRGQTAPTESSDSAKRFRLQDSQRSESWVVRIPSIEAGQPAGDSTIAPNAATTWPRCPWYERWHVVLCALLVIALALWTLEYTSQLVASWFSR